MIIRAPKSKFGRSVTGTYKPETLSDVIARLEGRIAAHRASHLPDVTVSYADLERLIHAALWGDD